MYTPHRPQLMIAVYQSTFYETNFQPRSDGPTLCESPRIVHCASDIFQDRWLVERGVAQSVRRLRGRGWSGPKIKPEMSPFPGYIAEAAVKKTERERGGDRG